MLGEESNISIPLKIYAAIRRIYRVSSLYRKRNWINLTFIKTWYTITESFAPAPGLSWIIRVF